MKSFIQSLIARVSSSIKEQTAAPVLGRWGIQYDEKIIACKIVQANEDHCGCCVATKNPKKEEAGEAKKKNSSVVRFEKREEYLVPYVM
jgi:hypothetical protein